HIEWVDPRPGGSDRRRPVPADSTGSSGIFHRSSADRHAPAGRCVDRGREPRHLGPRDTVSRSAGGAAVPRRGDSTRMTVLEATDLTRTFVGGDGGLLTVLDGVSLQVDQGEMVAIVGSSGAGKSTLLHLLGALDRPTRGRVSIRGAMLDGLDDESLARLRNQSVGFVFQ